jgi:hypothetical protein
MLAARTGIGAQLLDQRAHLLAGGAVHAFDRPVAGYRVTACGKEGLAALRIGLAQLPVAVAQLLQRALSRIAAVDQLPEQLLNLLFTGLELLPVLVHFRRLAPRSSTFFHSCTWILNCRLASSINCEACSGPSTSSA